MTKFCIRGWRRLPHSSHDTTKVATYKIKFELTKREHERILRCMYKFCLQKFYLLGYNAVCSLESNPTFQRKCRLQLRKRKIPWFLSGLNYFTLKKLTACSSETSSDFQRTTLRCVPEDRSVYNHCCENLPPHRPDCAIKETFPCLQAVSTTCRPGCISGANSGADSSEHRHKPQCCTVHVEV